MGIDDSTESRIQLEILRERQKHFEDRVHRLEHELVQVYTDLGGKEKALELLKEEREDLKVKLEVLKKDYQYTRDLLTQSKEKTSQKRRGLKLQTFCVGLVFLLSSILINVGTNMFTSAPPNPSLAWVIIVFAVILYLVATFLTTIFALESEI